MTCSDCAHWHADVTGLHGYCTELIALFPAAAPSCGHHYEPRGLPNLPPLEDSACSSDS